MKICQRMRSRFDSGLDYIFFLIKTWYRWNFFKKKNHAQLRRNENLC